MKFEYLIKKNNHRTLIDEEERGELNLTAKSLRRSSYLHSYDLVLSFLLILPLMLLIDLIYLYTPIDENNLITFFSIALIFLIIIWAFKNWIKNTFLHHIAQKMDHRHVEHRVSLRNGLTSLFRTIILDSGIMIITAIVAICAYNVIAILQKNNSNYWNLIVMAIVMIFLFLIIPSLVFIYFLAYTILTVESIDIFRTFYLAYGLLKTNFWYFINVGILDPLIKFLIITSGIGLVATIFLLKPYYYLNLNQIYTLTLIGTIFLVYILNHYSRCNLITWTKIYKEIKRFKT